MLLDLAFCVGMLLFLPLPIHFGVICSTAGQIWGSNGCCWCGASFYVGFLNVGTLQGDF